MTPLNLSVVFAPTIMRARVVESMEQEIKEVSAQRDAMQYLLEQAKVIYELE